MRVLHIANNDKGGAANAMLTLHDSLLSAGIDSRVLVLYKYKKSDLIHAFLQNRRPFQKLKDSIAYRLFNIKRLYHRWLYKTDNDFTYYDTPYDVTNHSLFQWSEIIHLHWYHNFVDLPEFLDRNTKPIVFTLHDENLFLGGFHYSYDKQIAPLSARRLDEKFRFIKTRILRAHPNIHFIAPSEWLFNILKQNQFEHIHQIPYGIDSEKFRLVEKKIAREKLGIDGFKKVYLLLAEQLTSKRKGIYETIGAFMDQCDPDMLLMIAGNYQQTESHSQIKYLGYINGSENLSYVYSAADIFINPALADNLPNTVLESLVCGTPVIGFDTGGMSDMINRKNGALLEPEDFRGVFSNNIFNSLTKLDSNSISSFCADEFSIEKQMLDHMRIYECLAVL
jgi:glycosyltransferase involved in cell wall biosynthesis